MVRDMARKMTLLTVALLLSVAATGTAHSGLDEFDVSFGIMRKAEDGSLSLAESTKRIPRIYGDKEFRLGLIISGLSTRRFTVEVRSTLPAPPKVYSGVAKVGPDNRTFSVSKSTHNGTVDFSFLFDEGDPLGEYSIEVLIDGKRKRVINFTVYDPTEE